MWANLLGKGSAGDGRPVPGHFGNQLGTDRTLERCAGDSWSNGIIRATGCVQVTVPLSAAASSGLAISGLASRTSCGPMLSTGMVRPAADTPLVMRAACSVRHANIGSQVSRTAWGTVMPPAMISACGSMAASLRACSPSILAPDFASTTSRRPRPGLNKTTSQTTVPDSVRTGISRHAICQPASARGAGLSPSASPRSKTAFIGRSRISTSHLHSWLGAPYRRRRTGQTRYRKSGSRYRDRAAQSVNSEEARCRSSCGPGALQFARQSLAEPHLLHEPLIVIQRHNAQAHPASTNPAIHPKRSPPRPRPPQKRAWHHATRREPISRPAPPRGRVSPPGWRRPHDRDRYSGVVRGKSVTIMNGCRLYQADRTIAPSYPQKARLRRRCPQGGNGSRYGCERGPS